MKAAVINIDVIKSCVPIKTIANINISLPKPFFNACSWVLLNPNSIYFEPTLSSNIIIPINNLLWLSAANFFLSILHINNKREIN